MKVIELSTRGALLLQPRIYEDERGSFSETFNPEISEAIGGATFIQDNESCSKRGVLRGMHYQILQPQGKLVRVAAGEVFDVVVDLRKHSPTFGKYAAVVLSAQNKHILWIPKGFAHGFLSLSEPAVLAYKCTDWYAPQHERTLIWNDPDVGIEWPLDSVPSLSSPLLSSKDAKGVLLRDAEVYP